MRTAQPECSPWSCTRPPSAAWPCSGAVGRGPAGVLQAGREHRAGLRGAGLAGRGELAAAGATGHMAALWRGVRRRPAGVAGAAVRAGAGGPRWAGMAAVLPRLVAGWPLAELSGRPALEALALLTGALFLGDGKPGRLLLGHWYLVDRRLSNRPIAALATWLVAGVAALISAALGGARGSAVDRSLSPLLAFPNLTVYLAVGLVLLCGLMASFIRVLVKGNSIQAATGMFYLAVIMALAAEFAAKVYLPCLNRAGPRFFRELNSTQLTCVPGTTGRTDAARSGAERPWTTSPDRPAAGAPPAGRPAAGLTGQPPAPHGAGGRRRAGPAGGRAGLGRRAARPRSWAGRLRRRVHLVQSRPPARRDRDRPGRGRPGRRAGRPGAGGRGPRRVGPARLGVAGAALALVLVAGGTGVWAAGAGSDHHPAAANDPAAHVHGTTAAGAAGAGDGEAMAEHSHGPNLPEVAAASDDERARAEPSGRPRRPVPSAGATRMPRPPPASVPGRGRGGPGSVWRFLHCPDLPAWRADGRVLDPTRRDPRLLERPRRPPDAGRCHVHRGQGAAGPSVGGPITRWHDRESCRDPPPRAKLGRPVDGVCREGQVYRRSGEMMHVWFTDDLATAFARHARWPPCAPPLPSQGG